MSALLHDLLEDEFLENTIEYQQLKDRYEIEQLEDYIIEYFNAEPF